MVTGRTSQFGHVTPTLRRSRAGGRASDYNSRMQIVIPGALPPVPVAAELARRLPEHAPTLSSWFQAATAQPAGFDVHAQGCTPFEAWQLEQAGYRPSADMPVGAGLGPLLAGPSVNDADPVWLAELAHLSLGTDQAALLHPEHMEVRAEESQALFATARPSFEAAGFTATPSSPNAGA